MTKVLRGPGHHRPKPLLEDSGGIHTQLFQSPAQGSESLVGGIVAIEGAVACKGAA